MATREQFISVQGGSLWCQSTGSGSATPLLVIHGIPGASSRYLVPLTQLARDREVIFYDQLGGGRSARPQEAALWTVERFTSEVAAVRAALGLRSVHILGHSWGAMLALEHILNGANGVRSLILSSTPVNVPEYVEDIRRLRQELPAQALAALESHESAGSTASSVYQEALMVFRHRHLCRRLPWPTELLDTLSDINAEVFCAIWGPDPFSASGAVRDYDRAASLHSLTVPTLFTVGHHDATTPRRAERHRAMVPKGRLAVFQESAHMSMIEQPVEYLAAVRSFLQDVDADVI